MKTIPPVTIILVNILVVSSCIVQSCTLEGEARNNETEKIKYTEQRDAVNFIVLEKGAFEKELVSNGKLKAVRKSEIKFRVPGHLQHVNFENGNTIEKGEILATIDQFEALQQLEEAEIALKKASIEFQDICLSYTGGKRDSANIPRQILETAALRSGYLDAQRQLKSAKYNLESTTLKAPITGKIANLESKIYDNVNPGGLFCLIIDDSEFEVQFQLIESEIREINLHDEVAIIPFSTNSASKGFVSEINPFVDENGLVKVKARIKNPNNLWEGMNVKVLVKKKVANEFIVPKSAVVLRQNQEVLFKYVNGRAHWTYVKTGLENSSSYTILPHSEKGAILQPGDTVIVSGNLHLAHESPVIIKN